MLKRFLSGLDQKYLKICVYAAVTVLLTGIAAVLLSGTGPIWSRLGAIFSAVLKPVIIGGIIWYLLLPVVNRFEKMFNRDKKRGYARPASVLITFGIIAAVLITALIMIIVSIYKNLGALNLDSITSVYAELEEEYQNFSKYLEQIMQTLNFSSGSISSILKGVTSALESFFSGLLFGVIFFMIFMKDADNAFSGYIRGQMVDAVIVGVLSSIALSIAGIPYAVLIGICMGFGNLIPYFGPIIGYAATVIVCIPSGDWGKMILGVAIIAIIMFIDGNIINPRLLSANVDVHPLLVVAALLGGGVLGGIAGMLVAVPTAALLKLQFDRYLQKLEDSKESMLS